MKQRILSLLVLLCMLVVSVPALVLPMLADGELITTKLEPRRNGSNVPAEELVDGKLMVKWQGGWRFVSHSNANWTDERELSLAMRSGGPSTAMTKPTAELGEDARECWLGDPNGTGLWNASSFMGYYYGGTDRDDWGPAYGAVPSASRASGYQYLAAVGGKINITLDDLRYKRDTDPGVTNKALFAVFVSGNMVWPKAGGSYADTRDWAKVEDYTGTEQEGIHCVSGVIAEIRDVLVKKGDKIEVLVRAGAAASSKEMWQCRGVAVSTAIAYTEQIDASRYFYIQENGNTVFSVPLKEETEVVLPAYIGSSALIGYDTDGDGVSDAQPGDTFTLPEGTEDVIIAAIVAGRTDFQANRPTWDDVSSTVTYHGGWTVGILDLATGVFDPFSAYDSQYSIFSPPGGVWGGTGGGYYGKEGRMAVSGCMPDAMKANSIRYTADYNAKVSLDFSDLRPQREGAHGAGDISMEISVYVNGKKVWPADSDWYVLSDGKTWDDQTNPTYDALTPLHDAGIFPLALTVGIGETVEIRSRQHDANCWMFWVSPYITYTELLETPVIRATSVTFGEDLGLNAFVNILGAREGSVPGLEYWTAEPTAEQLATGGTKMEMTKTVAEDAKFTYRGFSAKQMADQIWVRPYGTVEGGNTVYGQVVAISIADYAKNAFGRSDALDKVIAAMVNYGANAQSYFNYNRENMANSFLPDAMKLLTSDGVDFENVYAQSGTENKITAVSMILGDRLGYKFLADKVEGAASYVLEYADNADFTDAKTVDMKETEDGENVKAIVSINLADAGRAIYVRVKVDGTAGATLTYNLDSYYLRMEPNSNEALYALMLSMVLFHRAAVAYGA